MWRSSSNALSSRRRIRVLLSLSLAAASGCSSRAAGPPDAAVTARADGARRERDAADAAPVNTDPTACTVATLEVLFSPMFSAWDGVHQFQMEAVANGVPPNSVLWAISDPSIADLQANGPDGTVRLTMRRPGRATVSAISVGACGSADLVVTAATPDQWATGNAIFNGRTLTGVAPDAGVPPTCAGCHGPSGAAGVLTPDQIGGLDDEALAREITAAAIPDGGYFDPSLTSYEQWQTYHHWTFAPDEATGLVVYLRSQPPGPSAQPGFHETGGPGARDGRVRREPDDGGH